MTKIMSPAFFLFTRCYIKSIKKKIKGVFYSFIGIFKLVYIATIEHNKPERITEGCFNKTLLPFQHQSLHKRRSIVKAYSRHRTTATSESPCYVHGSYTSKDKHLLQCVKCDNVCNKNLSIPYPD